MSKKPSPEEEESYLAWAVRKLWFRGCWLGNKHLAVDNLTQGMAHSRYPKSVIVDICRKRGLVLFKPAKYGEQCWLNTERKQEIKELILKYYPTSNI